MHFFNKKNVIVENPFEYPYQSTLHRKRYTSHSSSGLILDSNKLVCLYLISSKCYYFCKMTAKGVLILTASSAESSGAHIIYVTEVENWWFTMSAIVVSRWFK